jgi:hypothetical protein
VSFWAQLDADVPVVRRLAIVGMLVAIVALVGCEASSAVDPRCRIEAEGRHRAEIAKLVNGSDLWQAFFDELQPEPVGSTQLVVFKLKTKRHTYRSVGGDYDPGTLTVDFTITNLRNKKKLYERKETVNLEAFMIGSIDANASREEIQEIAFRAIEDKVYPYIDRWINIAAVHAMAQEGAGGKSFVPILSDLAAASWTTLDLRNAAKNALRKIQG